MLGRSHRAPYCEDTAATAPNGECYLRRAQMLAKGQTSSSCTEAAGLVEQVARPGYESADDGMLQIPEGFLDWTDETSCVSQSPRTAASNKRVREQIPHSFPGADMQIWYTDDCERTGSSPTDPCWAFSEDGAYDMSWSTPVTNNTPSFASMNHLSAREGGPCSQGSESGEYRRSLNQQQNDALRDFLWDQRSRGYSQSSNDTLVPSGFYPIESTTLDPPEVIRANSAATKIPEEPLPLWMFDYMDDFGATGTCLGDQAHESPGGNPRANIGWSHDCINGEQGQALSDACQQAIQLESQSSNAPEFESTGGRRSESIELDNSLAGLDQADFRSVPYFDYFEPDGRDRLGNPLIESLDYDRCLIPASEMIADSLQPAIDSECIAEGSGEHLLSLFGQSNSEQTQPPSLIIVYCNGRGGSSAVDGVIRPTHGRHGPLPRETASRVAKTRKEKTVCIPCRTRKVSCDGNSPCKRCSLISKTKLLEQPCLKAHFVEIVRGGSCNYFSQREINHLTLDGSRRISKKLPEELDFDGLLSLTEERRHNFNVGASQDLGGTLLWTLDLSELYEFLLRLQKRFKIPARTNFRAFLDDVLPLASQWKGCVKDLEEDEDLMATLYQWNMMPSYVSFRLIRLAPDLASLPLDVEDPAQEDDVILAAQLSRIVCRALETDAFDALQKRLNKPSTYQSPAKLHKLCFQIGQVLLQFRWRIAWWNLSGEINARYLQCKQRYIMRLKQLTSVLYFYYCAAQTKLPSYGASEDLKGIQRFKDGRPTFFEYFPHDNSIPGWELWMELGMKLVAEARQEKNVGRQDPYPKVEISSIAVVGIGDVYR